MNRITTTSSNRTFMELKFDEVEEVKVWRVEF